jgi:hypothetical protein
MTTGPIAQTNYNYFFDVTQNIGKLSGSTRDIITHPILESTNNQSQASLLTMASINPKSELCTHESSLGYKGATYHLGVLGDDPVLPGARGPEVPALGQGAHEAPHRHEPWLTVFGED